MNTPSAPVIAIDSHRSASGSSIPTSLPRTNRVGFTAHKSTRQSFVEMFRKGRSVRRIARFYSTPEADVENEIRANLLPPAESRRLYERVA